MKVALDTSRPLYHSQVSQPIEQRHEARIKMRTYKDGCLAYLPHQPIPGEARDKYRLAITTCTRHRVFEVA